MSRLDSPTSSVAANEDIYQGGYSLAQGKAYFFPRLKDSLFDECGLRTQADMLR